MGRFRDLTNLLLWLMGAAATCILGVLGLYFFHFHEGPSNDAEAWGQFGDFVGGALNPLLSFFALIGLLLTISEQKSMSARSEEQHEEQEFNTRIFELLSLSHTSVASVKISLPIVLDPDVARMRAENHYEGHRAIAYAWKELVDQYFSRIRSSEGLYDDVLLSVARWKKEYWSGVCNYLDSMIFLLLYAATSAPSPRQSGLAIMAIQSQLSLDERALIFYLLLARIYDFELLKHLMEESEFFDDVLDDPFIGSRRGFIAESKLQYEILSGS